MLQTGRIKSVINNLKNQNKFQMFTTHKLVNLEVKHRETKHVIPKISSNRSRLHLKQIENIAK